MSLGENQRGLFRLQLTLNRWPFDGWKKPRQLWIRDHDCHWQRIEDCDHQAKAQDQMYLSIVLWTKSESYVQNGNWQDFVLASLLFSDVGNPRHASGGPTTILSNSKHLLLWGAKALSVHRHKGGWIQLRVGVSKRYFRLVMVRLQTQTQARCPLMAASLPMFGFLQGMAPDTHPPR